MPSVYDFEVKDKKGEVVKLDQYKGKVILVVNVASKCGFTPQYAGLEKIYKKYEDQGLVILGFPCNQFLGQEPGTNEEISQFCQLNYGVTFPIMQKIDVNGSNADPFYEYLKSQKKGPMGLKRIKWNFEKFLIDQNGKVVERFSSLTKPESIDPKIGKLLSK
ncbi:hypothetical protein KAFR_0G03570 [Kazachstania africana CBS 2517]|uniref:Glutathione peroxidase n=1 Tax=Kazachstania africana (strain ATCC 22294 / BCRC 22015 / CBS 2517 / CECT 1963 / NBRC 1671 / NRRL Y-8276) TaxID=1071382 RepID=H2AYD9_KAZAF|nr:hypothetical protein KAFR_0G03570 [Kazachstania africana CBS 2517]CCF59389.1 hypothetical protein KAFR_0G03570 [Kazachstania africana CBS 2517]